MGLLLLMVPFHPIENGQDLILSRSVETLIHIGRSNLIFRKEICQSTPLFYQIPQVLLAVYEFNS